MNPIEQFKLQLKEYEPIFNARENIASLHYTPEETLMQGARRRPQPDEEEEDIDMVRFVFWCLYLLEAK